MKKVLLFIVAMILLFLLSFFCSYGIYKKSTEYADASDGSLTAKKRSGAQEELSGSSSKETVETITKQTDDGTSEAADSEKNAAYEYFVSPLNGYVAVFTSSGSLYEFTDIKLSDLDSGVKERIRNGIKFQKEKELFTFLESCSS